MLRCILEWSHPRKAKRRARWIECRSWAFRPGGFPYVGGTASGGGGWIEGAGIAKRIT